MTLLPIKLEVSIGLSEVFRSMAGFFFLLLAPAKS
jgi:hypothetical protein